MTDTITATKWTIEHRGIHDDWTVNIACARCGTICAGPDASAPVPISYAVVVKQHEPEMHGFGSGQLVCKTCADTKAPHLWTLAEAFSAIDDALMDNGSASHAERMLQITEHCVGDLVANWRRYAATPAFCPNP